MKRLIFIFAFLLCCSAIQANARGIMTMCGAGVPVAGGITQDTFTSASQTTADHSFTHSQGSLTNGIALLFVGWTANAATSATATYGGSEMTLIETVTSTGGQRASIYKLDLGTSSSGDKTVVVDFDDSMYRSNAICITYSGVAQSTSFTDGNANSYTNAPSITLATTKGSRMISLTVQGGNRTFSSPSGTQLYLDAGATHTAGVQWASGTGGNVALSWSSSATVWTALSAVVITPAP